MCGFELPPVGRYAVGIGFLPQDAGAADKAADAIAKIVDSEGLRVLGWRDLPIDDSMIGRFAQDAEPTFVSATDGLISSMTEVWTDVAQVPPTGTRPGP